MLPTTPIQDLAKPVLSVIRPQEPEKPKFYTIKPNDSLTTIAEAHKTTVQRLWSANTELDNPDLIEPDKPLKIPQADEELTDRPLPTPPAIIVTQPTTLPSAGGVPNSAIVSNPRGNSAGNTYSPGYCTHYAKQQRPDLPNNLGNADTWFSRAAAQGYAVSYTPQVGAVAAAIGYMHVAIVTGVHGDKVTVTEMNYKGRWVVSSREAPASEFRYIY